MIPKMYKMNFFKAKRELKLAGGIDRYEYVMYQYYPKFVVFEAYMRKAIKMISRKIFNRRN